MALNRIKIGSIVTLLNEKNTSGEILQFLGLNKEKEFIQTIANTKGLDVRKYNILKRGYFAINGMHVGRDIALPLGLYNDDLNGLISPAYKTFKIDESIMIPEYFFMMFNSDEKARYCAFLCDGDVREGFDWDVFCNMEIDVPPIEIQKKYVAIYDSLLKNEKNSESSFDDLKRCFIAYIENLRRNMPKEKIGKYIYRGTKNSDEKITKVLGIGMDGFMEPQKVPNESLRNYKILEYGVIAYAPPLYNIKTGALHLYTEEEKAVCSPIYETFYCNTKKLLPEYLITWLKREEFKRYAEFYAMGIRNTFDYELMEAFAIPIPEIKTQKSIAEIYLAYIKIKKLNEKLKSLIKDICPILIRGAIYEASKS